MILYFTLKTVSSTDLTSSSLYSGLGTLSIVLIGKYLVLPHIKQMISSARRTIIPPQCEQADSMSTGLKFSSIKAKTLHLRYFNLRSNFYICQIYCIKIHIRTPHPSQGINSKLIFEMLLSAKSLNN